MHRRRIALVAVVASAVTISAAVAAVLMVGQMGRACTAMGCQSEVTVDLTSLPDSIRAAGNTAAVCADDHCRNVTFSAGTQSAGVTISERTVRHASIRITDARGVELVNLRLTSPTEAVEVQPNGPDCEPICWFLELTPKDGALHRSVPRAGLSTPGR